MRQVALAFGLGDVRQVLPVTRGAMGSIFRVDTTRGSWAVKELFAWNPGDNAEEEAELRAAARALGVTVPLEVRALSGQLVADVDGTRYRVFEWVDLDSEAPRPVDQVGLCLASLHNSAQPDDRPLDPWYEVPPARQRWTHILRTAEDKPWAVELEQLVPPLLDLSSMRRPVQPRVTCHRDFIYDNVIPLRAQGLAVLDWENVGPLEPEQELGYVLLWSPGSRPAYSEAVRQHPRLKPESFATGIFTWLNFLAVQAEAAIDPASDAEQRAFADQCVRKALDEPVNVPAVGV